VKIVAYYLAIVMLILFVGVVIYRLLFGTPCTIVGNYCVGDGWTMAGLAATILGVAATVLGILGAFALAAWWTGLDDRVRKQVDTSLKQTEEALNKRVDDILAKQEAKITLQFQEDLRKSSIQTYNGFLESKKLMQLLADEIRTLRNEYEDINKMADNARRLAVDAVTSGSAWDIDSDAMYAVHAYRMVDIAVKMVYKYLGYIEAFLSVPEEQKDQYVITLKENGAPYPNFEWFWNNVLRWQNEVNGFSNEHPDTVKQVNDRVESYQNRIDEAKQSAAHEV
jgi:hypothetical protein